MTQRSKAVEALSGYFEEKGDILNPTDYRKQEDTPIRPQQVKRIFGTWSRMEKIVRAFDARNKNRPEPMTNARELVAETNRELAEQEALIRSRGEDIEQKTAREEAARLQTEADALNAATPEGARENKVRKGGPESVDAKTIKESAARALATEHAMLAATPEGAAMGKELLGGVEDQDKKNLAIARQNARTERSALLAATPTGAALAKEEEDDSDGHLTREAHARLKGELRLYVDPATKENVGKFVQDAADKARPDVREAILRLNSDEGMSLPASERGDLAHASAGVAVTDTDVNMDKAPPADRPVDDSALTNSLDNSELKADKVDPTPPVHEHNMADMADMKMSSASPKAAENKESVNLAQNKDNPEAPPADRNPDPAKLTAAAERKTPPKK